MAPATLILVNNRIRFAARTVAWSDDEKLSSRDSRWPNRSPPSLRVGAEEGLHGPEVLRTGVLLNRRAVPGISVFLCFVISPVNFRSHHGEVTSGSFQGICFECEFDRRHSY